MELFLACWSLAAACTSLCLFAVLVFAVEAVVELGFSLSLAVAALLSSFFSLSLARCVWATTPLERAPVRHRDFRSLFRYAARVAVHRTRSFWVGARGHGGVDTSWRARGGRGISLGGQQENNTRTSFEEEEKEKEKEPSHQHQEESDKEQKGRERHRRRALLSRSRSFKRILGER